MKMELNYIIVQAGGKGTRMENLTHNKPKALVPINNLPMIFHLFRKYPSKKFIIIGGIILVFIITLIISQSYIKNIKFDIDNIFIICYKISRVNITN